MRNSCLSGPGVPPDPERGAGQDVAQADHRVRWRHRGEHQAATHCHQAATEVSCRDEVYSWSVGVTYADERASVAVSKDNQTKLRYNIVSWLLCFTCNFMILKCSMLVRRK